MIKKIMVINVLIIEMFSSKAQELTVDDKRKSIIQEVIKEQIRQKWLSDFKGTQSIEDIIKFLKDSDEPEKSIKSDEPVESEKSEIVLSISCLAKNSIRIPDEKNKKFKCTYEGCEKTYTRKDSLDSHIFKKHKDPNKRFICEKCGNVYPLKDSYTKHKKRKHEGVKKRFICGLNGCKKAFWTSRELETHQNRIIHQQIIRLFEERSKNNF